MARPGVSLDQVAAVADKMVAEGLCPETKSVRDRLGTGSPNTIQIHLTAWREIHPKNRSATIELPASIIYAISQEIERVRLEAKADAEAQLMIIQAEASELALSGEKQETEREEFLKELIAITTNRDMLRGMAQEQAAEIDRLTNENKQERCGAERARAEVTQIRDKIVMQAERLSEMSATIDQLTTKNSAESQARISAEKDAAVLTVKLESDHEKQTSLLLEKAALIAQVGIERQAAETARIESAKRASELGLQSESIGC